MKSSVLVSQVPQSSKKSERILFLRSSLFATLFITQQESDLSPFGIFLLDMTHFRLLLNGVSLPKDYVSLRKASHLSKEGRNSSSSLKRTWFFVSWLAKHNRNPIRIDLNRKTGRTWTPDSFLSSRMSWSSLLPCLG